MKILYVLAVAILGLGIVFLAREVMVAREAAREASCQGRMNQLQLALSNYELQNGHLPPAYILGPDGKPWHSWRVLILPYMEMKSVYDEYRFDEPWNGPNNRKLADKIFFEVFQCGSGAESQTTLDTNYVAVVGEGTAFPGDKTTRIADFTDGLENTILLVEVADAGIHWMEPRDLSLDSLSIERATMGTPAISSHHPRGAGVVFADKITAYRLQPPLRPITLRALATIADGEQVTRDSLLQTDDPKVLSESASK